MTVTDHAKIEEYLGAEAQSLLGHKAKVSKDMLHLPGSDFINDIYSITDRNPQVLRSLGQLFGAGRLGGTGYPGPERNDCFGFEHDKSGNEPIKHALKHISVSGHKGKALRNDIIEDKFGP